MNKRTPDERRRDLDHIDQLPAQNETVRDSFLAVAHTLFAAFVEPADRTRHAAK